MYAGYVNGNDQEGESVTKETVFFDQILILQ